MTYAVKIQAENLINHSTLPNPTEDFAAILRELQEMI